MGRWASLGNAWHFWWTDSQYRKYAHNEHLSQALCLRSLLVHITQMTTGNVERSSSSHQITQWSEWPCGKNLFTGCDRHRILLKFRIGSLQTQNTRCRSVKKPDRFLGGLVEWNKIKEELVVILLTKMPKLLKISSVSSSHVKLRATWTLMWHSYRRAFPIRTVVTVTVSKRQNGGRGAVISRLFELLSPFFFLPTYFFSLFEKDNYFPSVSL